MISILEVGKKKTIEQKDEEFSYIKKCYNCGCKFLYQNDDIREYFISMDEWARYVKCPQCRYRSTIWLKRKYRK